MKDEHQEWSRLRKKIQKMLQWEKNSEVENWLKVIFFSQSIENNGPETNNGHMGYCGHLLCKEIKGEWSSLVRICSVQQFLFNKCYITAVQTPTKRSKAARTPAKVRLLLMDLWRCVCTCSNKSNCPERKLMRKGGQVNELGDGGFKNTSLKRTILKKGMTWLTEVSHHGGQC